MAGVIAAFVYRIFSDFFGAGRTGNYLKIRKGKDSFRYGYRILPIYKLILRRVKLLYIIILVLHICLPLFYAFGFSVLLMAAKENPWWQTDENGSKQSVFVLWQDAGYSTVVFAISVLIAELILILINIFVFPLVFDIAVKIFHG